MVQSKFICVGALVPWAQVNIEQRKIIRIKQYTFKITVESSKPEIMNVSNPVMHFLRRYLNEIQQKIRKPIP